MFAKSHEHDPFVLDPHRCDNPTKPRAHEIRKRHHPQHMVEADRCRRAELEIIQQMEENLKIKEFQHQMETLHLQLDQEEELRRPRLETIGTRDDARACIMSFSGYPPSFITFASISQKEFGGNNPSRDSASLPPRSTVLKPDGQVMATSLTQNDTHGKIKRADTDFSSICTEEHYQDPGHVDGDETSALPHLIAFEDVSDIEEDEDLNSIWTDQASDPGQRIGLNESLQSYEITERRTI